MIESREGLVGLAQMDILEIHTWNTRYRRVEYPDRIVLAGARFETAYGSVG